MVKEREQNSPDAVFWISEAFVTGDGRGGVAIEGFGNSREALVEGAESLAELTGRTIANFEVKGANNRDKATFGPPSVWNSPWEPKGPGRNWADN